MNRHFKSFLLKFLLGHISLGYFAFTSFANTTTTDKNKVLFNIEISSPEQSYDQDNDNDNDKNKVLFNIEISSKQESPYNNNENEEEKEKEETFLLQVEASQNESSSQLNKRTPLNLELPPTEKSRRRDFKLSSFRQPEVWTQTKRIVLLMGAGVAILYFLPEGFTNWRRDEFGDNYIKNVKTKPTWDEDKPAINYIGHPYAGAVYYRMGIDAGLSPLESLVYSTFLSTVVWEYGFEALAEGPSIQDLVLTSTLGSILGELFIRWDKQIKKNNGTLLGSKRLGNVTRALMNPMEAIFGSPNKNNPTQTNSFKVRWIPTRKHINKHSPQNMTPLLTFQIRF